MNVRRTGLGIAALALSVVVVAGCSPSSAPTAADRKATVTTTHWWSGTDYCGILRQTMQAGHSVLAGVDAKDPALLTATQAFVADLTAAAPAPMRAQWQVLGPALTDLVGSGGTLGAISGVNSRRVAAATTAIATDAKTRCHLDLSA